MRDRFNEARRRKIPRARYRVQNWPEYDRALQQRGSLTVWVTPEALAAWQPPRTGQRGRPRNYSDVAIETGLKVHGAGEWRAENYGEHGRREWRKRRLAVDPSTGESLACALTSHAKGDAAQLGLLREQIPAPLGSVVADGAYDGEPVHRAVAERQSDPPVAVIIPPRSTAVPSAAAGTAPSQRDRHIALIRDTGHRGWQAGAGRQGLAENAVDYGRRSLGETAMFRYKALIGPGLRARGLPAQQTQARAGGAVLNRMSRRRRPTSQRVA